MIEAILVCMILGADIELSRRAPERYYCVTGEHRLECAGEALSFDVDDNAARLHLVDDEEWS